MNRRLASTVLVALAAAALAAPASAQRATTYKFVGVGDIMMGSDYPTPVMDPRVTPNADPAAMIGRPLAAILKSADVTFGNMEGTLHESNAGAKICRNPTTCYVFRSPGWHADVLKRVGFNLVSIANNHGGDFGQAGHVATFNNLKRAGIVAAGRDMDGMRTAVLVLQDGTRVGLAAFGHNPGLPLITDLAGTARIVRELRGRSDLVVVSFHGGAEGGGATRVPRAVETFLGENRGDVWRFAHTAIDAGAHIVFGHGPHVPRAVEVYKGRFIAYSLGNFWTYGRFNLKGSSGIAPVAEVVLTKAGALWSARLHSIVQDHPGGPKLDPAHQAAKFTANLTAQNFPEARLTISPEGHITGPGIGGK